MSHKGPKKRCLQLLTPSVQMSGIREKRFRSRTVRFAIRDAIIPSVRTPQASFCPKGASHSARGMRKMENVVQIHHATPPKHCEEKKKTRSNNSVPCPPHSVRNKKKGSQMTRDQTTYIVHLRNQLARRPRGQGSGVCTGQRQPGFGAPERGFNHNDNKKKRSRKTGFF